MLQRKTFVEEVEHLIGVTSIHFNRRCRWILFHTKSGREEEDGPSHCTLVHDRPSAKSSYVRGKCRLISCATSLAYTRISYCAAESMRSVRNINQLRRLADARILE